VQTPWVTDSDTSPASSLYEWASSRRHCCGKGCLQLCLQHQSHRRRRCGVGRSPGFDADADARADVTSDTALRCGYLLDAELHLATSCASAPRISAIARRWLAWRCRYSERLFRRPNSPATKQPLSPPLAAHGGVSQCGGTCQWGVLPHSP